MKKVKIENNAFVYPMPMVLVGSTEKDKPNFMAVGWVTRVNFNPPMIAIALGKMHYTNKGIHEHRVFSVNVPGSDLLEKTDATGLVSGEKADKSQWFTVFYGNLPKAPMIQECKVCMAVKLVHIVDLPSNEIFIGEIVEAYAEEDVMTANRPDIQKIAPFTLTMPDNNYWKVGANLGKAWGVGKDLVKKISKG